MRSLARLDNSRSIETTVLREGGVPVGASHAQTATRLRVPRTCKAGARGESGVGVIVDAGVPTGCSTALTTAIPEARTDPDGVEW